MGRAASILLVLAIGPLVSLGAQDTSIGAAPRLPEGRELAQLPIGTPVRVAHVSRPRMERVTFAGVRGDSLVVIDGVRMSAESSRDLPRSIPLSSVTRLEMCPGPRACDSRSRLGMVVGAMVGAVGGYFIGRALDGDCDYDVCGENTAAPALGAVIGVAGGLALGGVAGALWPTSAWESVRFRP